MKTKQKFLSFILMLVLTLSCFACKSYGSVVTFNYFSTLIRIETHDKPLTNQIKNQLDNLFSSIDNTFDLSKPNSSASKLNSAMAGDIIEDFSLAEVLALSKELHDFSNGKYNPTVSPLSSAWQFDTYPVLNFTPPTQQCIEQAKEKVINLNNVIVDTTLGNVIKPSVDGVKFDFGGIVKGYAVDKAIEILNASGYAKGYVSIGSSSIGLLNVDNLTVRNPRPSFNTPYLIKINTSHHFNACVSTSGDSERYYNYQGKRYSHIIDPTTGYPSETGIVSSTFVGGSGAFGDAITTAICLMHYDEHNHQNSQLIKFLNKILSAYPDSELYVCYLYDDSKILITNKTQGEDFTLLDTTYSVVQI